MQREHKLKTDIKKKKKEQEANELEMKADAHIGVCRFPGLTGCCKVCSESLGEVT